MSDDATTADLLHLRASGVSVVVDLTGGTLPRILHWGADLGDLDGPALQAARQGWLPVAHGYPVDGDVEIAVLPQESAGFLGTPGLVGSRAGQDFSTSFVVGSHHLAANDGGTQRLTVHARDDAARLALSLVLELTAQGLLRQQATLTNEAEQVYGLDGLLLTFPVPTVATELLDFSGRWARERSPQRTAFTHGTRLRENRRGVGHPVRFQILVEQRHREFTQLQRRHRNARVRELAPDMVLQHPVERALPDRARKR